jgi:cob(I)alamin adenosyltransferase
MSRIYTGRGDSGETDLLGGKRVPKDDLRIEAIGDVDELNAIIGVAIAAMEDTEIIGILHRIQNDLFTVGADLSVAPEKKLKLPKVQKSHIESLESYIGRLDIGDAKEFVIPGGSGQAANLQMARAVARRAERTVVALSRKEKVNPLVLQYLNRLSTLLYALALSVKKSRGMKEEHPAYKRRSQG